MTPDFISPLRRAFGFKLEPLSLPDGGLAFVRFLQFASAESSEAKALQDAWALDAGKTSFAPLASNEDTASFIDWLIRTQWGEAPQAANDPTKEAADV